MPCWCTMGMSWNRPWFCFCKPCSNIYLFPALFTRVVHLNPVFFLEPVAESSAFAPSALDIALRWAHSLARFCRGPLSTHDFIALGLRHAANFCCRQANFLRSAAFGLTSCLFCHILWLLEPLYAYLLFLICILLALFPVFLHVYKPITQLLVSSCGSFACFELFALSYSYVPAIYFRYTRFENASIGLPWLFSRHITSYYCT